MGKGRTPAPPGIKGRPPKPEPEKQWCVAPTSVPTRPDRLTGDARYEYDRLTPYLKSADRIAEVDLQPLMAYCMEWGRFSGIMEKYLAPEGTMLYEDGRNCDVIHPQLPPLLRAARDIYKIAGLFGCTARTRDLEGDAPSRVNSALKRLFGNRRKVAEGKVPDSILPMLPEWKPEDMHPPLWMNSIACDEFERLGRELSNIDLFTPLDYVPLCVAVTLWELHLRAQDQLAQTDGFTYVKTWNKEEECEEDSYRKEHPLHKAITDILTICKMYWTDYGISPRNRRVFTGEERSETRGVPLIFKGKFGG